VYQIEYICPKFSLPYLEQEHYFRIQKNMLLERSWLFEEFASIVTVSLGTTIFLVFIVKETYGAILRVLNITDQSK